VLYISSIGLTANAGGDGGGPGDVAVALDPASVGGDGSIGGAVHVGTKRVSAWFPSQRAQM
jgi:hypothetical protein